jgi:hypothetical protein
VKNLPKRRSRKNLHYRPTLAHPPPAQFPVFPSGHTDIVVKRILVMIIVTSSTRFVLVVIPQMRVEEIQQRQEEACMRLLPWPHVHQLGLSYIRLKKKGDFLAYRT